MNISQQLSAHSRERESVTNKMACHTKVLNISSNRRIKRRQAIGRVEHCVSAWVEFGFSIRDLSLAESIAKRNEQATMREPLEWAECPGLIYRADERNQAQTRQGYELVKAANQFAEMQA
jgi:hypothetical protein